MASQPTSTQPFARRSTSAAVALAAGAVGMLAQLVWARILIQWFGTSSLTIATALAASLAGLAIGAFLFRDSASGLGQWLGPQKARPGWLLLLAGIGVLEGLILFLFDDVILPFVASSLPGHTALLVLGALVLVPLNIMLGGVLPTLVQSTGTESTKTVGTLYAAETVGGAAGALLAGFWLIQTVGHAATLLAAALVAIVVGAVSIFLSKSDQADEPALPSNELETVKTAAQTPATVKRIPILVAIFLAGVASLSMEIIWQRALILLVGTDTHSFMIVAASYLVGVALGSWICGWFSVQRQPSLFSFLQLGVALTSLVAMAVFCGLVSGEGQRWLMDTTSGSEVAGKRFVVCFGLLILPSCLTGASFPAAVSILMQSGMASADATGRTYATIAAGNIAGVIIVGFLLIPILGLQTSLIVLVAIAAIAAGLGAQRWSPSFLVVNVAVFLAAGYLFVNQQPIGMTALSPGQELVFYREGPVATVSVVAGTEQANSDITSQRMVVDGIVIGENLGGVDEKQKMLAHLPLLIHAMANNQSPKRLNAISIGLGTGILAGELATQPSVENVTCVELSPAVIQASEIFSQDNHDLASLPNATIVQGDGIHFLRRVSETFDCVVSDGKSRPGHAGNVGFFSSEYYRLAGERLSDSGTFVQWASLDGSLQEVQTILKTFSDEFPYAHAALAPPDSIYLIGRGLPIHWDDQACDEYLAKAKSLHPYGWRTSDDIRSMAWLDLHQIESFIPDELATNSLDRPVLERFALDIHRPEASQYKVHNLAFLESCLNDELKSKSIFDGDPNEKSSAIREACSILVRAGKHTANPANIDLATAANLHKQALKTLPNLSRGIHLADRMLAQAEQLSESLSASELGKLLQSAASLVPADPQFQLLIGNALIDRNQFSNAAGCFHRVTRLQPDNVKAHVSFGRCLVELGKFRAAIRPLTNALQLQPDHEQAQQLLRIANGQAAFP
jgi:spermidine synthase